MRGPGPKWHEKHAVACRRRPQPEDQAGVSCWLSRPAVAIALMWPRCASPRELSGTSLVAGGSSAHGGSPL